MRLLIVIASLLHSFSVLANIECKRDIEKCENATTDSQTSLDCIKTLESNCSLANGLDLRNSYLELKEKLEKNLRETENEKTIGGECQDGMKWGYFRAGKKESQYILFTDKPDLAKLHGTFEKKDKCEETRLLDEGFNTSNKCFIRFIVPKKTQKLYFATAMADNAKQILYFSDIKKCKSAVSNGISFSDEYGQKYNFSHQGSESKDCFIKSCEKEDVIICEPNKVGEVFTKNVI